MNCKHVTEVKESAVKVQNTWWKITVENCTKCYKQVHKEAHEVKF